MCLNVDEPINLNVYGQCWLTDQSKKKKTWLMDQNLKIKYDAHRLSSKRISTRNKFLNIDVENCSKNPGLAYSYCCIVRLQEI